MPSRAGRPLVAARVLLLAVLAGCASAARPVSTATAGPTPAPVAAPVTAVAASRAPQPMAAVPAPLAPVSRADAQWADSVLATLSLRDRVAQLVFPWVLGDYAPTSALLLKRTLAAIETQHVGGIIISIGSPIEVAAKLNWLQRASALPLLVGADLETGSAFRLRGGYATPNGIDLGGATMFPMQMGIGATRDTMQAYRMGLITAREGRTVGIQYAFAPVLDVNNNPKNPVIGARSFAEDPELVGALGAALIRGLHDGGMAATAKHFPGHGDTEQNSHLELARVTADRARLERVELAPFRKAIAAGVDGIMTFHGRLDALDPSGVAATLSKPIMTDLLRGQMGFGGLVVTDALDMNGVMGGVGLAEVCQRSLEAGADILLMPTDIAGCIDAIVGGVNSGRIPAARVDASVRRVLGEKARFGLAQVRTVDVEAVRTVVGDSVYGAAARDAAEHAITLAKDSLHQLPLASSLPRISKVLAITIAPRSDLGAGTTFDAYLKRRFPGTRSELFMPEVPQDATVAQLTAGGAHYVPTATTTASQDPPGNLGVLVRAADSSDVVIISSYVIQTSVTASASAPRGIADLVQALRARGKSPIVISFGNPYLLREIPDVAAYLVAWGSWGVSQQAAARAVLGEIPMPGVLPTTVGPGARTGTRAGVPVP
jgi:beta-N-acetylhexosaminidase